LISLADTGAAIADRDTMTITFQYATGVLGIFTVTNLSGTGGQVNTMTTITEDAGIAEPLIASSIADAARCLLVEIGENLDREGLKRTPQRFEKAMKFLTSGYQQDEEKVLNGAVFSVCYDEMVVVKDIEIFSL